MSTPFSEAVVIRHLRNDDNVPYATVATRFVDGVLFYGVSVCNSVDQFSRTKGRDVATRRLNHAFTDRNNTDVTSRDYLVATQLRTSPVLHGCVYDLERPNDVWFIVFREEREFPVSVGLALRELLEKEDGSETV